MAESLALVQYRGVLGGHAQQFDLQAEAGDEGVADVFGLPQGKPAFAGGDDGG